MNILILLDHTELNVFKRNYLYIKENIIHKHIVVIAEEKLRKDVKEIDEAIIFVNEDLLLKGLNIECIKALLKKICGIERRAGWYFQQFLKMGYALQCKDEYYLIWDSDTIPVKNVDFFSKKGIPYLDYRKFVPFDEEYYVTYSRLFEDKKIDKKNKSFVTEHMLINTELMKKLIMKIEKNRMLEGEKYWEKIIYSIRKEKLNLSGFSEFETYANFVIETEPSRYELREWRNLRNGKFYFGNYVLGRQLQWIDSQFDAISIENYDREIKIFISLIEALMRKGIKFEYIYKIFNPLYNFGYFIMIKLRNVKRRIG